MHSKVEWWWTWHAIFVSNSRGNVDSVDMVEIDRVQVYPARATCSSVPHCLNLYFFPRQKYKQIINSNYSSIFLYLENMAQQILSAELVWLILQLLYDLHGPKHVCTLATASRQWNRIARSIIFKTVSLDLDCMTDVESLSSFWSQSQVAGHVKRLEIYTISACLTKAELGHYIHKLSVIFSSITSLQVVGTGKHLQDFCNCFVGKPPSISWHMPREDDFNGLFRVLCHPLSKCLVHLEICLNAVVSKPQGEVFQFFATQC